MSYLSTGALLFLPSRLFSDGVKATRACARRERWLTLATPCALAARAPSPERAPRRSAKGDIDEGAHGLSQRLSRSREPGNDLRLRPRRAVRRCRLRRGAHLRWAALQAARAHRPALPLLQLHAHAALHDRRRDGEADPRGARAQPAAVGVRWRGHDLVERHPRGQLRLAFDRGESGGHRHHLYLPRPLHSLRVAEVTTRAPRVTHF